MLDGGGGIVSRAVASVTPILWTGTSISDDEIAADFACAEPAAAAVAAAAVAVAAADKATSRPIASPKMVVLQPLRFSYAPRHPAPICGLPDTLKSQLGPFASRDIERQVEKNWAALAKIYGDSETARVAVLQNRQVVSPVYADPALLQRTRDILVEKLGREEAMQVMQDNPAVLTCGEPLANETPADIVSTAKLRKVLDATLKPDVVAVIVVLAVGGVIARLAAAAY